MSGENLSIVRKYEQRLTDLKFKRDDRYDNNSYCRTMNFFYAIDFIQVSLCVPLFRDAVIFLHGLWHRSTRARIENWFKPNHY